MPDIRRECFLKNDLVWCFCREPDMDPCRSTERLYVFWHLKYLIGTWSPIFRAASKAEVIANPTFWETTVKYSLNVAWNFHQAKNFSPGCRDWGVIANLMETKQLDFKHIVKLVKSMELVQSELTVLHLICFKYTKYHQNNLSVSKSCGLVVDLFP